MRADWNASLGPEAMGDNHLRSTSFEQRGEERQSPRAPGCKVIALCNCKSIDRWITGSADLQMSYQGQVFHFSSEAARKRFEGPRRNMPRRKPAMTSSWPRKKTAPCPAA